MDKTLAKIICCPACQKDLKLKEDTLTCKSCKMEYIVKDNIPVLLTERI